MKISACMIVKNEEKNIGKCIESYKNIVSEIIVVDTGSDDNTVTIAKELGAKVYYYKWNNSFCRAKNFALGKAKGDWIIFLDADEYFDSTDKIENLLNSLSMKKIDCVVSKLINIDRNLGLVKDVNPTIRIFRNSPKIKFKNDIHEVLDRLDKPLSRYIIDNDDIIIYHTGYSSDIIENKVKRNIELIEETMIKKNDYTGYYYLCDSYFALGKYELAIENGNKFIDSNITLIGFNSKVYKNVIESMINLEYSSDEIRIVINKAMDIFNKHPMFYYYKAIVDYFECSYVSSLECFNLTLEYQKQYNGIEMNVIPSSLHIIYYYMGQIFELKNDMVNAFDYYYKSLKANKYNESTLISLIKLLKNEKVGDTVALLNTIYNNSEGDIRIIITALMKIKHGELLLHYYNIWNKVYNNEDISLMFVFFSNNYYEKSFDMFYNAFLIEKSEEFKVLAIVSAIFSKKTVLIHKIINIVDDAYINIINSYLGKEKVLLKKDNLMHYTKILQEIVLVSNNREVLNMYLDSVHRFESAEMVFPIVKILKENCLYDYAINILSDALRCGNKFASNIYFEMGCCYYKLTDYINAVTCFKNALDFGYSVETIICYLRWIKDIDKNINDIDCVLSKYSNEKENLL
ncbi:glycosyltransferase [Candidatus Clostridium helianthi]|uniref:Glycosyltransferase n=1 Tax=Candidatus Clostridium helianthi TaxID=3381660 RepID=A0ABW8S3I4_9CLOT